jgi:hypothetical protein
MIQIADVRDGLDLAGWERDGYLHIPAVLDAAAIADLRVWVDDVSTSAFPASSVSCSTTSERITGRCWRAPSGWSTRTTGSGR